MDTARELVLKTVIREGKLQSSDAEWRHLVLPFALLRKETRQTGTKYVRFLTALGNWVFPRCTLQRVLTSVRHFEVEVAVARVDTTRRPTAYVRVKFTKPGNWKGEFILRTIDPPFLAGEFLNVTFPQGAK